MRGVVCAAALLLLTGCASNERFLWEEYTAAGLSSIGAGHYPRAEQYLTRALAKAEELGPQEQGISLNSLGELYRRQRRNSEAEHMFIRALEVKEAGLGRNHPDVAVTLTNLGLVYLEEERPEKAAPLLERALSIQETRSSKSAARARTLAALAVAYHRLGRDAEAAVMEDRARATTEQEAPER